MKRRTLLTLAPLGALAAHGWPSALEGAADPPQQLPIVGLIANQSSLRSVYPISPFEARGASFIPGSNVLRLATGELHYVPEGIPWDAYVAADDPGAAAAVAADRAWLAAGRVPGGTPFAERALLEMRALTRPNGATAAAWYTYWNFCWPRDGAWVAAAFSATGHHAEARAILGFLARTQKADGTWEARYHLIDGAPVADGRKWQLDANGWMPWAIWVWHRTETDAAARAKGLAEWWPVVHKAADFAARCLGPDGLPPAAPDYWESRIDQVTIGTAAPLWTGLRAAAELAKAVGDQARAGLYREAAARLHRGIGTVFAPRGYPRSTDPGSGADSAVTFMAPPFAPADPHVLRAVRASAIKLTVPNGGIVPGEDWTAGRAVAWTPETGFFALAAAASGDGAEADRWLRWIESHRTVLGAIPEKVDGIGRASAVAPLGWTDAIVLLALSAREKRLPTLDA